VLSAEDEAEQDSLDGEIAALRTVIETVTDSNERADSFLEVARRYREFAELTPAMLNEFVDKIIIGERAEPNVMYTEQKVEIYFNFIGPLAISQTLTEADEETLRQQQEQHLHYWEYHRERYQKCKETGVSKLSDLDTRTLEQRAADETEKKRKQHERYTNYQREYSLKHAESKREYARQYRAQKKAEKLATEQSAEAANAKPNPAA
jgi:hypothetical protein